MNLSEPQLISPLLDGFVMGDPISDHDGVKCCPAMHLETGNKYIVKIISVPASPKKLAALLLAGAFSDRESALAYFKELSDDVIDEAALLQRLSRFEGFVSYDNWQLVPMEDDAGYDIYLLGAYRPTLESLLKENKMTHLAVVNLGLDLCAALSVARRHGYLYADLQPGNIFICNDREYRIGDLGFISLDSLLYASLPDKYLNHYTPLEIKDAYSALNSTMDTYAVGLILYQAYNDGLLPPIGMPLQPPRYADFELSEIILKACSLNPNERWQEPMEMGQALISYLQRNSVNDTPIVPVAENVEQAPEEEQPDEPTTDDILAEVDEALECEPTGFAADEQLVVQEESPVEAITDTESEQPVHEETQADTSTDESAAELSAVEPVDEEPIIAVDPDEAGTATEDCVEVSTDPETPDQVESSDETQEDPQDDVSGILAQADDLIAQEIAAPVIELQQIEISMPKQNESDETEQSEEPSQESPEIESEEHNEDSTAPVEASSSEELEPVEAPPKKRHRGLIAVVITVTILLLLLLGGFLFYENYYLQVVNDILLSGSEDRLTVTLDTRIDDEKLTVLCTDTYGNTIRQNVVNGVASFEGLKPGTTYKLQVRIDGFHKLLGETTETYTTAVQTTIGNLFATTGPEDGSVILNFTVQGPDTNHWKVHYSADGEPAQSQVFSGHMVTVSGLTVGKDYTFTLEPAVELYLSGTTSINYVPRKILMAENLQILGFKNKGLNVSWDTPADATVEQWSVRCYNDAGYDQTLITADNSAVFEGLDTTLAYTIEVTADGMTVGTRTYLSANSITIQEVQIDDSTWNQLALSWDFEGTAPANGWLVFYTVDVNTEQQVITCEDNTAIITPLIPGAHYTITVTPANGATYFGGIAEHDVPEAAAFSGYWVKAEDIEFSMCITPDVENWDRTDVPNENYTTSFTVGSSASFVMHLTREYDVSDDEIVTMFVIRNAEGKVISNAIESRTWTSMWFRSYGKLTIPFMPDEPGHYTVYIYFNGAAATNCSFDVIEAAVT